MPSKCQASNQSQPIIITDEKKKAIDTIEGKKGVKIIHLMINLAL